MKTKEEFLAEIENADITFAVILSEKDSRPATTAFIFANSGVSEKDDYFTSVAKTAIGALMDVLRINGFGDEMQLDTIKLLAKQVVEERANENKE